MGTGVRKDGGGLKPYQLRQSAEDETPAKDSKATKRSRVVADVFDVAHGEDDKAKRARFKKTAYRSEFAERARVAIDAKQLSIGGERFDLPAELQDAFPLLEPDEQLLAWTYAGVKGEATTLISASPGSEAGDKVEWLLIATKT